MAKARSAWRRANGRYHYNGDMAVSITRRQSGWVVETYAPLRYPDGTLLTTCSFGALAIAQRAAEASIARHKPQKLRVGAYVRLSMGEPGLVQVLRITEVEPSGRYQAQHSHFEGELAPASERVPARGPKSWGEAAGENWELQKAIARGLRAPARHRAQRKGKRA